MAAALDQECVLDARTFNRFAQLVYAKCGIVLSEKKEAEAVALGAVQHVAPLHGIPARIMDLAGA